jgi:hypothetical protein
MVHKIILTVLFVLTLTGCTNNNSVSTPQQKQSAAPEVSKQVYRFQINFDSGSSVIKEKYLDQIKEFAQYLHANHEYTTDISGYTDSDGDEASNLRLSQERADAVKQSLVAQGINPKRIHAVGYGEAHPIASNDTPEGKFQNRRVEATITSHTDKVYHNPGIIEGTVVDAITKTPLGGVSIKVYKDNALVTFVTTDIYGKYRLKLDAGTYVLKFLRTDYLLADVTVVVTAKETTTIMQLDQIAMQYTGTGSAGGMIVNAFNGKGIPNLKLTLRKGWNSKSGKVLKTLKTDKSGHYVLHLPSGYYTVEASKKGYATVYFNILVIGKQQRMSQNGSISPQINKGQIRIILTWNKLPLDLDAHINTPQINHRRYHVYFSNRGSKNRAPYVDLDLDDRHSYGPETITIYKSYPGTYTYFVDNYSRHPDIKTSGARVQVYASTGLIKEFHIPSSGGKKVWKVFSYDGTTGKITPINKVTE